MNMHEFPQGSPEWRAHRVQHWNASDAPAMLGISPYKTRTALLDERASGISPEIDEGTQALFDNGHRMEALARPLAEKIIGEDLYPVTGSDEAGLSASFDGITLMLSEAFEHKSLNAELRACMRQQDGNANDFLPEHYQVQMEQQCMVSGCKRVLFMASKWDGDTLVEERHCWYTPNPALAKRIRNGWLQFSRDLATHKPEKAVEKPLATLIEALPALTVRVEGKVVSSNLDGFRAAANAFLANIKTELATDQDFADAEKTVKFCKDGEERLELVKAQALAQTASIDELFRTIDHISAEMRQKRLDLDRKVTRRKEEIRGEIVAGAQTELDKHVASLNTRLGTPWMPRMVGGFSDAIKGKRTVASLKDAVSVALANAKIDASAVADRLEINRNTLLPGEQDWFFLFADFATVGTKPVEDFKAIADQRIAKHKADEAARVAVKPAPAVVPVAASVSVIESVSPKALPEDLFAFQSVADDEGPDAIRVGVADGRVVIQLSQPMQWFGMTPEQAAKIAVAMTRYACELDPSITERMVNGVFDEGAAEGEQVH